MRVLVAAVFIAVLPGAALAGDVFGSWMIFPGPNPEPADLLPHLDPDTDFRVGQIIFDYPRDRLAKVAQPVDDLSKLQSVADAVKAAGPGPALDALVGQQLMTPHRFDFETATVENQGDAGLVWYVTFALYPQTGVFSGVLFRYRAALDGRGNVILPRMRVFDAFFHSPKDGWTCSVLEVPASPTADAAVLAPLEIQSRAVKSLRKAKTDSDAGKAAMKRLVYENQELIQIPATTDANGKLIHAEIWAVNFYDPSRTMRPDEVFTVWVTKDGHTADIQHLDHCWDCDKATNEPEPQ